MRLCESFCSFSSRNQELVQICAAILGHKEAELGMHDENKSYWCQMNNFQIVPAGGLWSHFLALKKNLASEDTTGPFCVEFITVVHLLHILHLH